MRVWDDRILPAGDLEAPQDLCFLAGLIGSCRTLVRPITPKTKHAGNGQLFRSAEGVARLEMAKYPRTKWPTASESYS